MPYYKLTRQNLTTYGDKQWVVGQWNLAEEGALKPCSPTALHGYTSPLLAVVMNPSHGMFKDPVLWECEFAGPVVCDGLKVFGRQQQIIGKPLPLPELTVAQLTRFVLLLSQAISKSAAVDLSEPDEWVGAILSGTDAQCPDIVWFYPNPDDHGNRCLRDGGANDPYRIYRVAKNCVGAARRVRQHQVAEKYYRSVVLDGISLLLLNLRRRFNWMNHEDGFTTAEGLHRLLELAVGIPDREGS